MADQLLLTVKRCLERYRFFDLNTPLVVAVSTGVDSMVLLTVLQDLLPAERIVVAHVNHHLRQQSTTEEAFIRNYCQQRGLKVWVDQWRNHPDHGIEMAARKERYRFFQVILNRVGSHYLLTAHHENDLAETMLMKLMRTGDVSETVGIQEARALGDATVLHPLLRVTKQQLTDYATKHGVQWFDDETNQQDQTLRNRFRHRYLPEWQKENPQVLEHLLNFHDQLTELLRMRDHLVAEQLSQVGHNHHLELAAYRTCSAILRPWVLQAWLNQQGIFDISRNKLQQLDQFLCNEQHPTARVNISPEIQLMKNYREGTLKRVQNLPTKGRTTRDFMVKFDHWYTSPQGQQFGIFSQPTAEVVASVWITADQMPLQVRPYQNGDRIRLKSGHHQTVRRILIDQKIPLSDRPQQLVVVDHHHEVLWVVGCKTAWLDRQQIRGQRYKQRYFCQK